MTTREDSFEVAVGHNRQLVDVLAAHQLKRLYRWSIWGNSAQLAERAHHAFQAGLGPRSAVDFPFFMRRHQSGHPPLLDSDEAATSGSQHVVLDKILQSQVALHCRAGVVHDVRNAPVPKS